MIWLMKKHWISLVISLVILWGCFSNMSSMPEVPMTDFDKLVHFLMFLGLGGCIYFENSSFFRRAITRRRILLGTFFFPLIFSGLIELGQEYLSPFRSGDWMDFLWDFIGSILALAICLVINKKLEASKSKNL